MRELGKSLLKVVTAHRIFRASCLVLTGQPSAWGRAVQCKGKGRLTAALDETLRELGKSLLKLVTAHRFLVASTLTGQPSAWGRAVQLLLENWKKRL